VDDKRWDIINFLHPTFSEKSTCVNAEELLSINSVNLSAIVSGGNLNSNLDRVTPGCDMKLEFEVDSSFPKVIQLRTISVALTFSEQATSSSSNSPSDDPAELTIGEKKTAASSKRTLKQTRLKKVAR
jgi:hypothetical protein